MIDEIDIKPVHYTHPPEEVWPVLFGYFLGSSKWHVYGNGCFRSKSYGIEVFTQQPLSWELFKWCAGIRIHGTRIDGVKVFWTEDQAIAFLRSLNL